MKVLVIFTGGTIGSTLKNGYIGTDDGAKYALLSPFCDEKDVEFETFCPYTILSENLGAKELNILQSAVSEGLEKGFDGIIVTHGTDTLQYSAAALSLAFGDCEKPIVLVSSAYPLDDERANGYENFKAALEFIRRKISGGVFVSYKNEGDEKTAIHSASALLLHAEGQADLESLGKSPFALFDGKEFEIFSTAQKNAPIGTVEYVENPGILLVSSHPADNFSYSLDGVRAVILNPYHSATLATANEGLKSFCQRAKDADIPVFVSVARKDAGYESTRLFEKLSIIPLPYGTLVFSYMRIWSAISKNEDPRCAFSI